MAIHTSASLFGVALALIITAAAATEDKNSANYILPSCRSFIDQKPAVSFNQGLCAGIVEGIAYMGAGVLLQLPVNSTNDKLNPHLKTSRRTLCIDVPNEVANGQSVRAVVAYIEARPARLHEDFRNLALEALQAVWPCR